MTPYFEMDDKKSTRLLLVFSWIISVFSILVYFGRWFGNGWQGGESGLLYQTTVYYSLIDTVNFLFATATLILVILATMTYRKEKYKSTRFLIIVSLLVFTSSFFIHGQITKLQT